MKKLINGPEDFVEETMEGIIYAHGGKVRLLDGDERILLTNYPVEQGKMGIVTAGDSGHFPVSLGYVSRGMLDGCVVGNVFASLSAKKMADMIKTCDHGSGVLYLYGNYSGDNMNFNIACEMVEMDDIEARTVCVKDDAANSPKETKEKRHGVAEIVYGFKIAGVTTERMMFLDEVATMAEKTLDNIRTTGVALSSCIVPRAGEPTFKIGDDEIEIGMGIHGEKDIEVRRMMTAGEVAKTLVDRITQDMSLIQGDKISVLVNGLGATPMEEQLIVYRCVHELLTEKGAEIIIPHIDEYATPMEMVGLSATIFKLDEQLERLLIAPAKTPFYTNLNK